MLETRLNGRTVQKQSTADLIFDCVEIVRFASQYVTLEPGDVIFTGTPGSTRAMRPETWWKSRSKPLARCGIRSAPADISIRI